MACQRQFYSIIHLLKLFSSKIPHRCPRFLLHHHQEHDTSLSTSMPQLPTIFHSCSPVLQGVGDFRRCSYYSSVTSLQTPSHTPTFKRVNVKSSCLPKSLLPIDTKTNETVMADTSHHRTNSSGIPSNEMLGRGSDDFQASNGVWKRGSGGFQSHKDMHLIPMSSNTEDFPSVKRAPPSTSSSLARYSHLAKYSTRHLPDPSSRCASRMVCIQTILLEMLAYP